MKKLNYLFVLFVAVATAFSSCKKDDDDNNATKIVGKWKLKKEIDSEYIGNQTPIVDEYSFPEGAYVEFKSNGTLIWNEDGSDPEEYSYRVDGNKLRVVEEGDEDEIYTIDELTSSKLVFSDEYSYTVGNQKIREVVQYTLEK